MVPDTGSDEDKAFEAHIAPIRDALVRLLDAADQLRDSWGSMPAADSQAMAELAAEDRFKGDQPWGADPVAAAHNFAQLLLFGVNDCARAAVRLLTSGTTPVYAHMVLARALAGLDENLRHKRVNFQAATRTSPTSHGLSGEP